MCYRILHVEDNLVVQAAVRATLAKGFGEDVIVCQVESLADALDSIEGACPDLILLDLTLTDSDGIDTLSMIRKECSTTPILVFSSSIEKGLPQKLARAGADLFIRKDQNFRVLQDVIPGLVERARMQREFLDTAKAELTKWSGIVKAEYQKQRIYLEDISAQLDSLGAEGDAQGYGRELSRTA